jgi:hypothetical protein
VVTAETQVGHRRCGATTDHVSCRTLRDPTILSVWPSMTSASPSRNVRYGMRFA